MKNRLKMANMTPMIRPRILRPKNLWVIWQMETMTRRIRIVHMEMRRMRMRVVPVRSENAEMTSLLPGQARVFHDSPWAGDSVILDVSSKVETGFQLFLDLGEDLGRG